jgi:hypothetical protein
MGLLNPDSETFELTPELLSKLRVPDLVELLLHRSSLFTSATTSHIVDIGYINKLQTDINALHSEIRKRQELSLSNALK